VLGLGLGLRQRLLVFQAVWLLLRLLCSLLLLLPSLLGLPWWLLVCLLLLRP